MNIAKLFPLALLALAAPVQAENLKSDAIICEAPEPLAMLAKPNLVGQPGSVVMKRVEATAKFYQLSGQANGMLADMASEEERIRAAGRLSGSSSAQTTQAVANQQTAAAQLKDVQVFLRECMATGPEGQPVSVIERHPISGEIKIHAVVKGQAADVWTTSTYIQ